MEWMTGFESTAICGSGVDVLENTRHLRRWAADLQSVRDAGVRTLRYPAPWHRIEAVRGHYNWEWMDPVMAHLRQLNLDPILDPLHHTSFPDWLDGGFQHPDFIPTYREFVNALSERYPWVRRYTPVNEPMLTGLFCGRLGIWHPHGRTNAVFLRMMLDLGKLISLVSRDLKRRRSDIEISYIGTCEHHTSLHPGSDRLVRFLNARRFILLDLLLGQTDPAIAAMFARAGIADDQLAWFEHNRAPIDVLGLDYYPHSEKQWTRGHVRHVSAAPRGFAAVATDYVQRFNLPIILGETNIRGFISDRLMWLKIMAHQCAALEASDVDIRGACWFPWIDSTDWATLVTRVCDRIDPVGIYYLTEDSARDRMHSQLVHTFRELATGRATWRDVPSFPFQPPWEGQLDGHLRLLNGSQAA